MPKNKCRVRSFKACSARSDNWANESRIRLCDDHCKYDLHTADARYHENCRKVFTNWRNISFSHKKNVCQDKAFNKLVEEIEGDI